MQFESNPIVSGGQNFQNVSVSQSQTTIFFFYLFDLFGVQVHMTKICYVNQNISQIWEIILNEHLGDPTLLNWNGSTRFSLLLLFMTPSTLINS